MENSMDSSDIQLWKMGFKDRDFFCKELRMALKQEKFCICVNLSHFFFFFLRKHKAL